MASSLQPPPTPTATDCQEIDPADLPTACGAASVAHQRCLAHLTPDQLTAYLATLGPGFDINARGVRFPPGLLAKLLNALRSGLGASIGTADFRGATFTDYVSLLRVTFAKRANFSDATFTKGAHFYRVTFGEDVGFTRATFTEHARFSRVSFKSADFGRVKFLGGAVLFIRASELVLTRGEVSGELMVEAVAGAVNANNLRGSGRLSLRLRLAKVNLSGLVFSGPVTVHALQHPLRWDESSLTAPATSAQPVRILSLAGTDAERLVVSDVDLTECQFAGMYRMDQLLLDGRCIFGRDPRGRRQVLAEEGYWRATQPSRRWARLPAHRWTPAPRSVEVVGPARLQVMYRQLRKAVEDAKNEPGAADFYYGEMEMRRAAAPRPSEKILLWLYWACSGYALRARRALACLAVTIAATITALTVWGFPAIASEVTGYGTLIGPAGPEPITLTLRQPNPVKLTSARTEKATEITLDAVIFRGADTQLTTAGHYLDVLARILGPLFLGLSALAIRNQVKR
jgi:uncharacterized protein YjbI with pentapeptide repeats